MANDDTTSQQYMVTTIDNPYSPFTQWDEWLALDEAMGYYTPGLLARYTTSSDTLSDVDQSDAINAGIDELIEDNPFGMYRKVTESSYLPEV